MFVSIQVFLSLFLSVCFLVLVNIYSKRGIGSKVHLKLAKFDVPAKSEQKLICNCCRCFILSFVGISWTFRSFGRIKMDQPLVYRA